MLAAIIVAAGSSQRIGFDKLFATIAGKAMIEHAIRAFEQASCVGEIIVVARKDRYEDIRKIWHDGDLKKVRSIIAGGERRQDSVRAGLNRLSADVEYVAVHDAARPLITSKQIERVFEQCRIHGAAALAEAVSDTIKRADGDLSVTSSVDRQHLYAMQTPQIFKRALIEEAYRAAYAKKVSVTDEVSAVELIGGKIVLVLNEESNFKITYPRDLALAGFVLKQREGSSN